MIPSSTIYSISYIIPDRSIRLFGYSSSVFVEQGLETLGVGAGHLVDLLPVLEEDKVGMTRTPTS